MLETDPIICRQLAQKMNGYNEDRKGIEAQLTEHALEQADQSFSDKPAVVVCGMGEAWNPGVVGIVAGKMSNTLGKLTLYWLNPTTEPAKDLDEASKALTLWTHCPDAGTSDSLGWTQSR